tara:strand:+ start:538 stop:834 length:297 start_codon:yes stop_codon:yes gene_type:complete
MKLSNSSIFNQSASLLKSIGHPIRFQIIIALSNNQYMTVTELSELLSVDQPVMSLHLAVLRKKDIIHVKKDGKRSFYSIVNNSVKQIVNITYNTHNTL